MILDLLPDIPLDFSSEEELLFDEEPICGAPVNEIKELLSTNHRSISLPDLSSYLSQPNMSVSYLIQHSLSVKCIIAKHTQIVEYLSENIEELLRIIFAGEEKLALQAYIVFGHLHTSLINYILKTTVLKKFIIDVLEAEQCVTHVIARACNMTALALAMSEKCFPEVCDYIILFPNLIGNDSILNFFEEILQDESFEQAHQWLASHGFAKIIMKHLEEVKINDDVDFYRDAKCREIINVFNIIRFSEKAPVIIKQFRSLDIIKMILSFKSVHEPLLDAKWASLDVLYNEDSFEEMNVIFSYAFSIISEPYVKISKYRISALHILEKMLSIDKTMVTQFMKKQLLQTLLRLSFQFQSNTFVLLQIQSFLSIAFNNKKINVLYVKTFIPPLMSEGTKDYNILMNSFSYNTIENAISAAAKDTMLKTELLKIDGFYDFVTGPLKRRRMLFFDGYGGKQPPVWA